MSETLQADVVVIGCGVAGAVFASELSAHGRSVVVLEQGSMSGDAARARILRDLREEFRRSDFNDVDGLPPRARLQVSSPPQDKRAYHYDHLVAVGGSTLHWAASTPRPTAGDLEVHRRHGYGRDWPMTYEELEPWLGRAERELGVAGADDNPYASPRSSPYPMPPHPPSQFDRELFAPACTRLGLVAHVRPVAVNSVERDGRAACRACRICNACPSGARYSADRVHVPRMLLSKRARLLTSTRARRLELGGDGGRIAAVHAIDLRSGAEIVVRGAAVVVAAGGVETPRLLMLSAAGRHARGLGNGAGALGRGFSDHLVLSVRMVLSRETGSRLGFPTTACDAFRTERARGEHNTFNLWLAPGAPHVERLVQRASGSDELALGRLRRELGRTAGGLVTCELEGRGQLALDPSKRDAFGDPIAQIHLTLGDRDRRTADRGLAVMRDLANALGVVDFSESWSAGRHGWGSHPSGGCAMSAAADQGVCDPRLRVFGIDNLFLASTAVFRIWVPPIRR